MIFNPKKGYFINSGTDWNIPFLTSDSIEEVNKHGGALSHFREMRIKNCFQNLKRMDNNSKFDFLDQTTNEKYEQRNINKYGIVDLIPSFMKGKGRSFDEARYNEKLNSIDYYIITMPYSYKHDMLIPISSTDLIELGSPTKIDKCFIAGVLGVDDIDFVADIFMRENSGKDAIVEFDIPICGDLLEKVNSLMLLK